MINRTACTSWTGHSAKTLREIIIGSRKLENEPVLYIALYVWIEFLRQNRSGLTGRTGDRADNKRQDGQQETGQTARDRTGIESKIE